MRHARTPSLMTKNETSGPVRHSSITRRSPAAPKRPSVIAAVDGVSASTQILRDDDAFTCRETIGLQARREIRTRRSNDMRAHRRAVARLEPRGRHVVPRHERLREGLARFEAGGAPRWDRRGARPSAANRSATPRLSGSSGPTTVKSTCSRRAEVQAGHPDSTRSTGKSRARAAAMPGLPGAQRTVDGPGSGAEPGDERVLARAAADDENSHFISDLRRLSGSGDARRCAGSISLTLVGD